MKIMKKLMAFTFGVVFALNTLQGHSPLNQYIKKPSSTFPPLREQRSVISEEFPEPSLHELGLKELEEQEKFLQSQLAKSVREKDERAIIFFGLKLKEIAAAINIANLYEHYYGPILIGRSLPELTELQAEVLKNRETGFQRCLERITRDASRPRPKGIINEPANLNPCINLHIIARSLVYIGRAIENAQKKQLEDRAHAASLFPGKGSVASQ